MVSFQNRRKSPWEGEAPAEPMAAAAGRCGRSTVREGEAPAEPKVAAAGRAVGFNGSRRRLLRGRCHRAGARGSQGTAVISFQFSVFRTGEGTPWEGEAPAEPKVAAAAQAVGSAETDWGVLRGRCHRAGARWSQRPRQLVIRLADRMISRPPRINAPPTPWAILSGSPRISHAETIATIGLRF